MNTVRSEPRIVNGLWAKTGPNDARNSSSELNSSTSARTFCESNTPYEAVHAIVSASMTNRTLVRRSYLQRLIAATGVERESIEQHLDQVADDWGVEIC